MTFISQGKASWKHVFLILAVGAIGGGVIFLTMVNFPDYSSPLVNRLEQQEPKEVKIEQQKSKEAKKPEEEKDISFDGDEVVVFDIYVLDQEKTGWHGFQAVPRIIGYESENFDNYVNGKRLDILGEEWIKIKAGVSSENIEKFSVAFAEEDYDDRFYYYSANSYLFFKAGILSVGSDDFSMGGAHPSGGRSFINYDLVGDKEIKLDDILVVKGASFISYLEQLEREETETLCSQEVIKPCPWLGCVKEYANEIDFYITNENLVIYFDADRHPYCEGSIYTLSIRDLERKNMLEKEGPLARLMNND